jgi:hypothetical protein
MVDQGNFLDNLIGEPGDFELLIQSWRIIKL